MTGARTISQFAHRVAHVRVLVFLVRSRFIIVGMTAGTIRLERSIAPVNDFRIALMTRSTEEIGPMIQRLVRQP